MILFLDNAEFVLDLLRMNAQEIHAVVEELSQFSNICLRITARLSTIPRLQMSGLPHTVDGCCLPYLLSHLR